MTNLQPRKREQTWIPDPQFLSLMFGGTQKELKELKDNEKQKISMFEKELGKSMATTDTLDQAATKIVRTALAAEFGPSILTIKEAGSMVKTIVAGIMNDSVLRKQALIIMDKFAKEPVE